jgi:hypothetical protein
MRFEDALFNWLQIRIVADGRPDDQAAKETLSFFEQILNEDHGLTAFVIAAVDDTMVHVRYERAGQTKLQLFARESAYSLLHDIEANPKYNGV